MFSFPKSPSDPDAFWAPMARSPGFSEDFFMLFADFADHGLN
jgi:hypothetical protein